MRKKRKNSILKNDTQDLTKRSILRKGEVDDRSVMYSVHCLDNLQAHGFNTQNGTVDVCYHQ